MCAPSDRPEQRWWHRHRAAPLYVDTALFEANRSELVEPDFRLPGRRMPSQFTVFKGSAWSVLSVEFAEYVLHGEDGFARHVLLYMANYRSPPEHYFHTVACNAPAFNATVVRDDLRFIDWYASRFVH